MKCHMCECELINPSDGTIVNTEKIPIEYNGNYICLGCDSINSLMNSADEKVIEKISDTKSTKKEFITLCPNCNIEYPGNICKNCGFQNPLLQRKKKKKKKK